MFANRFTAFVDACSLVGALRRNLLLTLAEADFFRLRWSTPVLDEVERAVARLLAARAHGEPEAEARRQRSRMAAAFEDALVVDFDGFLAACGDMPDPDDKHVLATALRTQAAVIVTENARDFPAACVAPLNIEIRSSDAFLADTIDLDPGKAVAAIRRMRERFRRPEMTAERLLITMEAQGLTQAVDALRAHLRSL